MSDAMPAHQRAMLLVTSRGGRSIRDYLHEACGFDKMAAKQISESVYGGLRTTRALHRAADALGIDPMFFLLTDDSDIKRVATGLGRIAIVLITDEDGQDDG